jgi:serine/threonine protein kinase
MLVDMHYATFLISANDAQTNVLIDSEGHVRLADFGLVVVGDVTSGLLTNTARGGTDRYMAPERLDGEELDRLSAPMDVYAFGCLCLAVRLDLVPQMMFNRHSLLHFWADPHRQTTLESSEATCPGDDKSYGW